VFWLDLRGFGQGRAVEVLRGFSLLCWVSSPPLFGEYAVLSLLATAWPSVGRLLFCRGRIAGSGNDDGEQHNDVKLKCIISGGFVKKTLLVGSLLAFGAMFAAVSAQAGTVAMGFIGAEGNQSGGVYTFPYDFTINGIGTYQLMCSSFNQHIVNGDQWTATVMNVANLDTNTVLVLESPAAGVQGYLEASYLFLQGVTALNNSNSDPEGLYNWAVWDLLTGQDVSGGALSAGDEAQVQAYLAAAVTAGPGLTPAQFSDVVIYTPTDMSASGPQEFFGFDTPVETVPEPGTVALVGFGVVGLAAGMRSTKRTK